MKNELSVIKKGLLVTAQDKSPLDPYKPLKSAPKGFPYEERKLMPPEDARKIKQTLDALNSRAQEIQRLDTKAKDMRVQVEEKITEIMEVEGYTDVKTEMVGLKEKLAQEVEETTERVGDVLLEHNNVVLGIFQQVTAGKAGTAEVQKAMAEAIKKYASKDVAGKIITAADEAIKAVADAHDKVKRRLVSWPSPQDLRKKIKQEMPKGASVRKDGQIWESVKGFFTDAVDFLRGIWTSVSDKLSTLWASIQQADPLVDEMKDLLAQAGTVATKKTAYRNSESIFKNRHDYAKALVNLWSGGTDYLFDELVNAMSDSEAFTNFNHIARINDIYFSPDGRALSHEEYLEEFGEE